MQEHAYGIGDLMHRISAVASGNLFPVQALARSIRLASTGMGTLVLQCADEAEMPSLLIRNVTAAFLARLKERAAAHHHSLKDEVCDLLPAPHRPATA